MKVICIAEKNSIAKAVADILGGGRVRTRSSLYQYVKNYDFNFNFSFAGGSSCEVTMTSVAGHLMNIDFGSEYSNWNQCDTRKLFDAPLEDKKSKDQQKIAKNIENESKYADFLMVWTDCDREGEYIGWEIVQAASKFNRRLTPSNVYRAIFSHLERQHILNAARNPSRLDQKAVDAVRTRMEIDLRAGVTFTRFLTTLLRPKILTDETYEKTFDDKGRPKDLVVSYGTCQFPTLGFVVDRYERIRKFVPEEFWYLQISVKNDEDTTTFQWDRGHLFDRLGVAIIYDCCVETSNFQAQVVDVRSKPATKYRPLPLTTVELQKNCARFFKMSAKKSLDAAEKLYQKGFISYPRTETDTFPQKMDLKALIEQQTNDARWSSYSQELLKGSGPNKFKWPRSGNHDDKAHPPIHPIVSAATSAQLTADEKKIYEYVVRHFLACCSEDARGQSSSITLQWGGEKFSATGIIVLQRNFLEIYPWMKWETTKQLPHLELSQTVSLCNTEMKSGKTSPPNHMTESELILLMDANGIGTDATIAEHIEKIQQRKYIKAEKSGKQVVLKPTVLGISLVHGFETIGLEDSFAKPFLRRDLEVDLKLICQGEKEKRQVVYDMVEMYRDYFNQTMRSKNSLLDVYDRVKANM